jgi:hypothetical protein
MPDILTVEDAMTRTMRKGHAKGRFRREPAGEVVATCHACGLRPFQSADGTIAGAPLLVECPAGPTTRPSP